MKKHFLAAMIPALLATAPSYAFEIYNKDGNKLDLYGRIRGVHYFSSENSNDGDKTYVRFGLKGATQITDDLTGYGQWEYQVQGQYTEANSTTGTKTRLAFAGLRLQDFGSLDYGRNYGTLYDVASFTDMLPEFGNNSYTMPDNFMVGRTNGVATYRNKNFFGAVDGLNFALQYQAKNEGDSRTINKENGDGFSVSSTYAVGGGVTLGAAYASSDRTLAQKASTFGQGDRAEAWTAGAKFDQNGVYLATMYAETRNMTPISGKNVITSGIPTSISGFANKTKNIEIVAQYQFDFGLRPSLAYIQSKGQDIEGVGDVNLVKYIDVASYYYFNKNMMTYVDYRINQLGEQNQLNLSNRNVVAVGISYQF